MLDRHAQLQSAHKSAEAVIVCVPVPIIDGTINTEELFQTLDMLQHDLPDTHIMVKSTITPDITTLLASNIVYSPSFFNKIESGNEFDNQPFMLLGGEQNEINYWRAIFDYNNIELIETTAAAASWCKYIYNSLSAIKILFVHELNQVSQKNNSQSDLSLALDIIKNYNKGLNDYESIPNQEGTYGFIEQYLLKDMTAFENYTNSDLIKILNQYNQILKNEKPND